MGGEKYTKSRKPLYLMGSPPHGRGKDFQIEERCAGNGITPAWAGKRSLVNWSIFSRKDHPRVGGEKA